MAKKAAKKKQGTLKGFERPTIDGLDQACQDARDARDQRMDLTKREEETKALVHDELLKHQDALPKDKNGRAYYRYEDSDGKARDAVLIVRTKVKFITVAEDDNKPSLEVVD